VRDVSDERAARLVIVDDNPAVLRQIVQLLPSDFEIVDTLEDGSGLRAAVEAHQPDLIVLDITLRGQSGITVASQLTKCQCTAGIVFLTVHSDADYVRAALAAGARGYVVKMRMSLDLVPALYAALEGRRFVSPLPELRTD
jgi:DNA-binding NarL/FixJ family response regulator